jgi:HK97 family phage portal protein
VFGLKWPNTRETKQNLELDTKLGSIIAPDAQLLALFGAPPTITGASVTPQSAMQVPAVQAAITLISDAIGTLPAKLFADSTDGGKEPDTLHAAYSLIHDAANDWTSASQLRTQLTADALLVGNGFAFANRVNGRVIEMVRLDPTMVIPQIDKITGEPSYKVRDGKATRVYPYSDILHIPAFTAGDGITGISPIHFAREAIALSIVLESHAARLFGRGARPSGVLKFEKRLDETVAKRISDSWHAAHAGEAAGRTAVLEEGGTFQALSFSSVDAQFLELRKFQLNEIARAFRVPPTLLQELDKASYNKSEELRLQFLQFTLLPWLQKWESAYACILLTPEERKTYSVEFVLDDYLRADSATRATAYGQYRSMGVMTANEVRARENLPAIAGGDVLENPYTTSGTPTPQAAP